MMIKVGTTYPIGLILALWHTLWRYSGKIKVQIGIPIPPIPVAIAKGSIQAISSSD